jgi:hypothetical protein
MGAGAVMLLLALSAGDASAQVFFVQGEDGLPGGAGPDGPAGAPVLDCDGSTCTVHQDLAVAGRGSFESTEADRAVFGSLISDELTVATSIWLPECPSGYTRDRTCEDCEQIVLCVRGRDQMVKVGDFWVDRYEASVWENDDCSGTQYVDRDDWADVAESFPFHGSFDTPLYACSVALSPPSRWLTWFQAQSACAASGKRLLTNAEWQAAVAGTPDSGRCRVSGGPRNTGEGSCVSLWGAEDMIGNLVGVGRGLVWAGRGRALDIATRGVLPRRVLERGRRGGPGT